MSGIQIENVTKKFGEFVAIEEMSLNIPDGAFCVLLGPSGCGKSTTLNLVAGLNDVTKGKIKIGERDVTPLPPHERDIAMVFQSSLLYPHLSALENIKMSLRNTDVPKKEVDRRIDHAVQILNIKSELGKKPASMSGGQRQRVAMAKAIVREPSVFLMDEPLASLDAALRQSLRVELVALQKQLGTTTIFVTHDQIEAMTMGDLIVVMNDGRVEQTGSPKQIYANPASRFVAGFIGSPQMNFLIGQVITSGASTLFETAMGSFVIPPKLLEEISSQSVELCVRPENVSISRKALDKSIQGKVFAIENLGKEAVIFLKSSQGKELRVIASPQHDFSIGDIAYLSFDTSHAHIFEL